MEIGSRVRCHGRLMGFVRSIEHTSNGSRRIGIELDTPDGWGDGECGGKRLFQTTPGYAMFVDSACDVDVVSERDGQLTSSTTSFLLQSLAAIKTAFEATLLQCAIARASVSFIGEVLAGSALEEYASSWLLIQAFIPFSQVLFPGLVESSKQHIPTLVKAAACLTSKKWVQAIALLITILPLPSSPFWWTVWKSPSWSRVTYATPTPPESSDLYAPWSYLHQLNATHTGYSAPLVIFHQTAMVSNDLEMLRAEDTASHQIARLLEPTLQTFLDHANHLHNEMIYYYVLINAWNKASRTMIDRLEYLDSARPQRLYGGFHVLSAPIETLLSLLMPRLAKPSTIDAFFNPRISVLFERGHHLQRVGKNAEVKMAEAIRRIQSLRLPKLRMSIGPDSFFKQALGNYVDWYFKDLEVRSDPGILPGESMGESLERLYNCVQTAESVSMEQQKTYKIMLAILQQLGHDSILYGEGSAQAKVIIRQSIMENLRRLEFKEN